MSAMRVSMKSFSGFCLFALALFLASCGGGGGGGGGDVPSYTVGGTVSGLTGSVTLQNNGGDSQTVSANGAFSFSAAIANAGAYNVTVVNQPVGPKCSVSNGSGTISGANVSNVAVACVTNLFQMVDLNGVGVSGVNVYLDGGAAPIGATDVTGSMQFNLTGVHSVDFHKAGRRVNSNVNQDWTAVSGTVTLGMPPHPDVATSGIVSGTISNTVVGDLIRVQSRRSSDGFASRGFPPPATGQSTPYSIPLAAAGTSDLFVFPNAINFPAASSFIGYSPGVAVPSAAVNLSLVRSPATSFMVTGAGGFPPPGIINTFYAVGGPAIRLPVNANLFTLTSASTSGTTLGATTVNVPPFDRVYPNAGYTLQVQAFSVATGANFQARNEYRIFPTYADLVAAATTPQNIVLTNDTLLALSPAHNAINVPVSPTFTWSRVGSPDFVEVSLLEYDPVRLDYAKQVWFARVYGNTFSVTAPATVTLNTNSFYAYELYARRDLTNGAGAFAGRQRNGWVDVKFSTGATTPP